MFKSNCLFVALFVYSTIYSNNAIICLEPLQVSLKVNILLAQTHEVVFTPVTLPRWAVLSYVLLICCIVPLLIFLYFLRSIQLLHIIVFTDVLGILQRVTSLKIFFTVSHPLLGAILRYFVAYFGGILLFWDLLAILSTDKMFFVLLWQLMC